MHLEVGDAERLEAKAAENPSPQQSTPAVEATDFTWAAAAIARLSRVPEPMRGATKGRVEEVAARLQVSHIDLDVAEAGIAEAKKYMCTAMREGGHKFDEPED
jgi:hypothetical protein